jgi:hypothetical protein
MGLAEGVAQLMHWSASNWNFSSCCNLSCVLLLLQGLLQDPLLLLASADKWSIFRKNLTAVLDELSKSPATVPAARTAAAGDNTAASATAAQTNTEAAATAAAADDEGDGTQCYLSSWRLFGLQLTDSSFRRDFLVQVRVCCAEKLV